VPPRWVSACWISRPSATSWDPLEPEGLCTP
jgi:hypothetical protein